MTILARGPQVHLDGAAQLAARGGAGRTMAQNIAAKIALEAAGIVGDGSSVDGTSITGADPEDVLLGVGEAATQGNALFKSLLVSQTVTGPVLFSGTLGASSGGALSGTFTGAHTYSGALSLTSAGTALDVTNTARARVSHIVGISPNNVFTVTPGATTADPIALAPSGAGGIRVTSAGPLGAAFTNLGRGGTFTVSGSSIDVTKFGLYANNGIAGTSTTVTLPAVGYLTCNSANVNAPTSLVGTLVANLITGGAAAASAGWSAGIFSLTDSSATNDFAGGGPGAWVAVQIDRQTAINQGGTSLTVGGVFGQNWGMDIVNVLKAGATYHALQVGLEINQGVNTGASAYRRAGIQLSSNAAHVVRGVFDDGLVLLLAAGGATYRQSLVVGGALSGTSPLGTDSKLLAFKLAQDRTATADIGVDLGDATFTTASIDVPGLTVGPTGTLRIGTAFLTATSTGLSIDAPGSIGTGTPTVNAGGSGFTGAFVDFDDLYGGVYTGNVTAGAIVSIATVHRQPTYPTTSPPATLALTARAPSAGTGAVLDGSWDTTQDGVLVASAAKKLGFYGTAPVAKPTGVAVSDAAIHAALVTLGLIAA